MKRAAATLCGMDITTLRGAVRGTVHTTSAIEVRAAAPQDIAETLRFASKHHLHVTTSRTRRGDVALDLSALKGVIVDPRARTAEVQAGTTWAELDAATQAHGLAVPGPRLSRTPVVHAVLQNASGWLSPLYGTTKDNLVRTERVYDVITGVTLRLHPLDHRIYGGVLLYRLADAPTALGVLGELASRGREFAGLAAYTTAPPEPFVPGDLVGRRVLAVVPAFIGEPLLGAALARPLRLAGPLVDAARPMTYVELQSLFDPYVPDGSPCATADVAALTPELLRDFEDSTADLRVLVPHCTGWQVSARSV